MRNTQIGVKAALAAAVSFMALLQPAAAQQLEKVTFALSYYVDASYANITAMADRFAKENGLEINVIAPGTASDTMKLVTSNTAQFGQVGSAAVLTARGEGVPIVSLAAPLPIFPIGTIAPASSGIKSIKDLEGKTVGLTGVPLNKAIFEEVMRVNKVDMNKTKVITVGFGDTPLLLAGKIDAIGEGAAFGEPFEWLKAKNLPMTDTTSLVFLPLAKNGGPDVYIQNISVTEDYLKKNGETVRKLLKAWSQATDWAIKNPDEAVALHKKHYPETETDIGLAEWKSIASYMSGPDTGARGYGWQSPEVWSKLAKFMQENKLLTNPTDPAKAYTNDYLPKK